jgi:hypothetical protein
MDDKLARWARYAPLALNVIGWVAIYFLLAGVLPKQSGEPSAAENATAAQLRALEIQLAKLEGQTQRLADRLDSVQRNPTDDVNRRLSQAQMARLESATARLEDELGNLRQRTHVNVDLNTLVQNLRPNVSFDLLRVDPTRPGMIDLTFQMRNLGPYPADVNAPEIILATKPIAPSGPIHGQLTAQDYSVRALPVDALLPNEPRNHAYTIMLNNPRRIEQGLYYRMTFRLTTDAKVVATSSRLLQGKVPTKDIQELAIAHYSHVGEVAPAQR